MTVASISNRVSFAGNGVTTVFNTSPLIFFQASDLEVYIVVNATGVATLKTIATHYTVSGGGGSTGIVTMITAPATGETLLIVRVVPLTQSSDFVNGNNSDAEVAEDAIDKLTMMCQQLQEQIDRSLLLPIGTTLTDIAFPSPSAGKFLRWNSTANGFENADITGLGVIGVPVSVGDGGTGATTVSAARANLDVDQAVMSRATEADVAQDDYVGIRDTSASTDDRAKVQDLFNTIGGMTVFSGTPDIDSDYEVIYDASQAAPKQRKILTRIPQVPIRQVALAGNVDSNGYANFLTTGSGLRPGLLATSVALALTYAVGFDDLGEKNYYERIAADVSDILGADLPVNNTSYIFKNIGGVWGNVLVPPDYAYAFDKTRGVLFNFEGADASTTMLDDFGNTWTAVGNAQIDTAQFKFGTSSLLLDGTGDYIENTSIKTVGQDSWEMSCWFRANAFPGAGSYAMLGSFTNSGGFGIRMAIFNNAGLTHLRLNISQGGTAHDINIEGTTNLSTATWYKARLVFDALGGTYKYYLSNNGAAETQEVSSASTLRTCGNFSTCRIGANQAATEPFNGWIDAFRLVRCATINTPETPSASAPTITDYPYYWFDIPAMVMKEITSASGAAGVNPGMTARIRLFVGECDTSGVAVTAAKSYALRGQSMTTIAVTAAAGWTHNHNIGVTPFIAHMFLALARSVSTLGSSTDRWVPLTQVHVVEGSTTTHGSTLIVDKLVANGRFPATVIQYLDTGGNLRNESVGLAKIILERGW